MPDQTGNTWDHRLVPADGRRARCYANCRRKVRWAGLYKTERRGRVVELRRNMCGTHALKWVQKYGAKMEG